MKYSRRITAAVLAGLMLCTNIGGANEVYGAPAGVDVDETMYVNLDYYGKTSKVNVVKSCNFNGNTEYTDYGTYENVVNMSSSVAPQIGDGTVTWTMPADQTGRFYYQCTMGNDQVTLPWDFDVSYKLNGVPANADQLAGASGLIEINVKATPNDGAREYYRNNMLLMVAVPVDLSKCYSVDAEGAQTQNLGETTAVVFTALPGEEGDYTVRIGTDSFETIGVIMAMAPGTVEDLQHIKDLKEAKDTWQDAGDELYDSLEQMAKSVESMRDGVNQVQSGLQSAESARQTWSGSKDDILAGNDQTLAALTAMSGQMETMVPHLQTAKDSAEVVHNGMNNIVDTLGQMQDPLRKLHTRLKHVENSMDSLSTELPEIQELMLQVIALDAQFQANEQVTLTGMSSIQQALLDIGEDYYEEPERANASGGAGNSGAGNAGQSGNGNESGSQNGGSGSQAGGGQNGGSDESGGQAGGGQNSGSGESGSQAGGSQNSGSGESGNQAGGGQNSGSGESGSQAGGGQNGGSGESGSQVGGGQNSGSGESGSQAGGNQNSEIAGTNGADGNGNTVDGGSGSGSGNENAGDANKDSAGENGGTGSSTGSAAGSDISSGSDTTASDTTSNEGSGGPSTSGGTLTSRAGAKISADTGLIATITPHSAPLVTAGADYPLSPTEVFQSLNAKKQLLERLSKQSGDLVSTMSEMTENTGDAAKYSRELIDNLDFLIEDITALNDSLDVYYPDLQDALTDAQELVNRTTEALNSGISTMTILQNTLKNSSDDFDAAARESLRGSMALLDKSLDILDSTTAMRRAGRTMKDTLDNELDKFDTDNRFLFMDPEAEKVSFTSDQNKAPKTLQIILRTDEISLDSEDNKPTDVETEKEHVSPLRRMWNVLVKMWQAIVSIFKER
ncbi:methyl-accepting chemotaxis protein [Enterocloster lavalensis]|uniref:methyl-accepting chemotaxis protein n=1 Tax=Enterocloster lavalensis TaxID=460384 RepID=UPI0034A55E84